MENKYQGVSAFQVRVYSAVCRVPKGRVTTYKLVAEVVGCGSAQAVGQALRKNPFSPAVPCHRVISSDFTIGGFMGSVKGEKLEKKALLLRSEGVFFNSCGLIRDKKLLWP